MNAPTPGFERTLLQLASATGALVNAHLASTPPKDTLISHLSAVFNNLLQAANEAHVTLAQAADKNLRKTADRWPIKKTYAPLFDEGYPPEEQLPRQLEVDIFERSVNDKVYVIQRCNGILIGDRLTDNIMTEDDYRFHDAFHYAYAAILGWSPVTRALFRLKRKSNPSVDHNQDGARAALNEEGVASFIFGHAKQLNFFEGQGPGDLSFSLLKTVRQFVKGYESESCPLWLWEEAILAGAKAFSYLRENRVGRLHLNLPARKLTVEPISQD
jgi:hypothetical protein